MQLKLKVSKSFLKNYNPIIVPESIQEPVSNFFSDCTRDQMIILNLINENHHLVDKLALQQSGIMHSNFLNELIQQSVLKHSGKKLSYSDHLQKVSLHIFMLAGPTLYNMLQKNLPLPSLSTVKRRLGQESPLQEGEFQVHAIKEAMQIDDEPMYVWVAGDDTKVTSRIHYNIKDDTIVGLELPLDENGVPKKSFFKFTTIKEVQNYLEQYPRSSYVKLMTCRSLKPESKTHILVIYGTKGYEKTEGVKLRWGHVFKILAEVGIVVVGKKKYFLARKRF